MKLFGTGVGFHLGRSGFMMRTALLAGASLRRHTESDHTWTVLVGAIEARMRGIVWFRRDLRSADHPALTAACEACSEVMPLFVFDEPLLKAQLFGSASYAWLSGGVADGIGRLWIGAPMAAGKTGRGSGASGACLERGHCLWNRDYEPAALERDRAVQQQLEQMGVVVRTFKDHVVFEAEEVRGATGDALAQSSADDSGLIFD